MMGFFSKVFEGFLNVFAVILLIAGAIVGGVVAGFIGVIIGILATIVFEINFFGAITQIFTIRNLLEKQNNILQDLVNKA